MVTSIHMKKAALKWGKLVAKLAGAGAAISGTLAAIFSSSAAASYAGMATAASGAGTYAAVKSMSLRKYESTAHVPPTRFKPQSLSRNAHSSAQVPSPGKTPSGHSPAASGRSLRHRTK